MDNSNRRKIRKNSNSKKSHEMNGNNQSSSSYKIENTRRQKPSRDCCNKDEKDHERISQVFSNYMHGQRLFTAVSDPAVCGYPMPLSFSYPDPIPLPVGYPMFQPLPYPQKVPFKDQIHSPRRGRQRKGHDQSKDTFQTVDEYTSLPPGNLQDIESDQQRRFSDPGLANNSESEDDSLSDKESTTSWYEGSEIANQIEALVQENKRLAKELKDTQTELQDLKIEVASLATVQSSCEPGFITELVREVHEATKLKEDTLLAKVKMYAEKLLNTKASSTDKLQQENDELTDRLARLEEQMKMILSHNSMEDKIKEELTECQKSNLQLKEELKIAVEAKDRAEAHANRYERLFNLVKKNMPNGVVVEERDRSRASLERDKAPPSLDTSESLTSSLGSGSLPPHSPSPSAQVTMSGPVTDL